MYSQNSKENNKNNFKNGEQIQSICNKNKKKIKMIESQPMRLYQESESWGRTDMADPKIHFTRGPFQWN